MSNKVEYLEKNSIPNLKINRIINIQYLKI